MLKNTLLVAAQRQRRTASMQEVTARYLSRYAEPETHDQLPIKRRYEQVLVVPAFDEPEDFVDRMFQHIHDDAASTLVIAVLNTPDNATVEEIRRTQKTLSALTKGNAASSGTGKSNLRLNQRRLTSAALLDILVVDRIGNRAIPARQGVGLARKIGADIALRLNAEAMIERPWLYLSDADVVLPADYFCAHKDVLAASAGTALFPFRHVSDDPALLFQAMLYELHIRYYAWGLGRAHSPYAFPSLGSTICVHAQAYAQVRGIPKRNAGEDFYFLNKLAKVAPITLLDSPEIEVAARLSKRVPFGTGPALKKMLETSDNSGLAYKSYNIESFAILKKTLSRLDKFAETDDWHEDPVTTDCLAEIGWHKFMATARRKYPTGRQRLRRVHEWFDGFRTLRFLHLLRREFPDQPLLETIGHELDASSGTISPNNGPGTNDPAHRLAQLRRLTPAGSAGVESMLHGGSGKRRRISR